MGGKALFEGSTGSEFIAGCDLPESHAWIVGYPPVNPVVFVLTSVLVLVVHLHMSGNASNQNTIQLTGQEKQERVVKIEISNQMKYIFENFCR